MINFIFIFAIATYNFSYHFFIDSYKLIKQSEFQYHLPFSLLLNFEFKSLNCIFFYFLVNGFEVWEDIRIWMFFCVYFFLATAKLYWRKGQPQAVIGPLKQTKLTKQCGPQNGQNKTPLLVTNYKGKLFHPLCSDKFYPLILVRKHIVGLWNQ